jgi:hypothetical protein
MSEGKSAGSLALNRHDQIVWAGDHVHVTTDKQYRCTCTANCGCVLVLKRGPIKNAHFAYPSTWKITGCTGKIPTPEAVEHIKAKWLIHDNISEFTLYDVCGKEHRVEKGRQFDALEWNCTVEKKIPGTARIADVLLQNMFTEDVVAIEVYNTHKVGFLKAQECKAVNVHIVEVLASTVNSGIRVLNNQRTCFEWDECVKCVEANKRDEQMELDQMEFDHAQFKIRQLREQAIQRELDELNKQHQIELGKKKADQLAKDIAIKERNKSDQLAKDIAIQERNKEEKLVRDIAKRERETVRLAKQQDLDRRKRLKKPTSFEEKRLEKMRVEYKRMGIKPTF